jgi:hypothetical protein
MGNMEFQADWRAIRVSPDAIEAMEMLALR